MRAGDFTFSGYSKDYAIIIILSYCILKKSVYMINKRYLWFLCACTSRVIPVFMMFREACDTKIHIQHV